MSAGLDDLNRPLVEFAGRCFIATGEWPELRQVVREIMRRHGVDAEVPARTLPSHIGHVQQERVVLSAEGLSASGSGQELLQALVTLARHAGEIYGGDEEPTPHDFIDEHQVVVNASAQTVWAALARQFSGPSKPALTAYLRVISAEPRRASGKPLDVDTTIPGFRVTDSTPAERLGLTGRHRFSRYRLVFDLTARDGKTVVCARTYASFPGLLGTAYQGLVIKSGAHRMLTRRLLRTVRTRAARGAGEANP